MSLGKTVRWTSVSFVLLQTICILAAPGVRTPGSFTLSTGPRIINGTEATVNSTKHQVSIRRKLNDGYFFGTGHICGGSVIDYNVVLSAAHCFADQVTGELLPPENYIAVMGNLDRFENNNNTLIFDIKRIVYLVDIFNLDTYEDDVALVYLNGTVPIDHPTVAPINLTSAAVPDDTMCQVTGWGYTEEGYLSDLLMTVDVPIINLNVCANDTYFAGSGLIREGMLCAGYMEGERDACGGDSGGPLVCNGQQGGIVSWGSGCALPQLPGVYTDVAYYYPWIKTQLGWDNSTENGGENEGQNGGSEGEDDGVGTVKGSVIFVMAIIAANGIVNKLLV